MGRVMRAGCESKLGTIKTLIADESGGVLIEYCLLVAVIALSQMTVLSNVGTSLSEAFNRVADDLRFAAGL